MKIYLLRFTSSIGLTLWDLTLTGAIDGAITAFVCSEFWILDDEQAELGAALVFGIHKPKFETIPVGLTDVFFVKKCWCQICWCFLLCLSFETHEEVLFERNRRFWLICYWNILKSIWGPWINISDCSQLMFWIFRWFSPWCLKFGLEEPIFGSRRKACWFLAINCLWVDKIHKTSDRQRHVWLAFGVGPLWATSKITLFTSHYTTNI